MGLALTRKLQQKILIGDNIVITVARIQRGQVMLHIEAPREIRIAREEIADKDA